MVVQGIYLPWAVNSRIFFPHVMMSIGVHGITQAVVFWTSTDFVLLTLCGVEFNIAKLLNCLALKFVYQLIYLLDGYLTRVVFVEYFENLMVLLSIKIKLVLLGILIVKNLRGRFLRGLSLFSLFFLQLCRLKSCELRKMLLFIILIHFYFSNLLII